MKSNTGRNMGGKANPVKKMFSAVLSVALILGICPPVAHADTDDTAPESVAVLADSDIDSGTIGSCTWVLDAGGCLTIAPANGTSGEFSMGDYVYESSWPWYFDRTQILTVQVKSGVSASGSLRHIFGGCSSLTSIDLSGFNTSNVTDMGYMFYDCSSLTSLDLSGFDTSNVTNMSYMFENCARLSALDLSVLNTSNVTRMNRMFYNCTSLVSLNLSGLDTSNATTMSFMFANCTLLRELDLSGFDTSRVTYMSCIFDNCSSLTSLDLSGFDTSQVTFTSYMFENCSSLTSLDLSGFNTSNMTDTSFMFYGCSSLVSLDLSGFNTTKVTNMYSMFYGCSSLTSLDLSSFDTPKVTSMSYMFCRCTSLRSLNLSSLNTSKVTDAYDTFGYCTGLRVVVVGEKFTLGDLLPVPTKDGQSGRWMSADGTVYVLPAFIPGNVATTYTAVFRTPSGQWSPGFYDVCIPKDWYFDSVYYLANLGVITGYSDTVFGVGDPMTRAQLVTILWRYCEPQEYADYNEAGAKNTSGLPDVADGQYYTEAVNWAVREGVITGYQLADGTYIFAPEDNVSFEQTATIVARYVLGFDGAVNYDTSALTQGAFTDAAAVDEYARGSMAWAIECGVITGNNNGNGTYTLSPLENVARERAATVLARAIQAGLITAN